MALKLGGSSSGTIDRGAMRRIVVDYTGSRSQSTSLALRPVCGAACGKWGREVREYEETSVDVVQESIRMGVLQDVLVDPQLRRHLIINATRMHEVEAALDASDDMDPWRRRP